MISYSFYIYQYLIAEIIKKYIFYQLIPLPRLFSDDYQLTRDEGTAYPSLNYGMITL